MISFPPSLPAPSLPSSLAPPFPFLSLTRAHTNAEDSDTSDDDAYFDDLIDRPGTGIINEKSAGKAPAAILSSDEAMWIAWYLCWYAKKCDAAPPERKVMTHDFAMLSTPMLPEEQQLIPRPATTIAPNMDFEARFGHLRCDNVPSRVILTRSKANWHSRALAFVGMQDTEKQARKLTMSGQHVSGKAIGVAAPRSAFAAGGFSPNAVRSAQGFAANLSRDASRAGWESPLHNNLHMSVRGQGPVSPLPSAAQHFSPSRSTSPQRPKSRQLPSERWESLPLDGDFDRGCVSSSAVCLNAEMLERLLTPQAVYIAGSHSSLIRGKGTMSCMAVLMPLAQLFTSLLASPAIAPKAHLPRKTSIWWVRVSEI